MKLGNTLVQELMQSEIRNMSIECERMNGINLSQGVCDMPLTSVISEAAKNAIQMGHNHYTRFDGVQELREQIAQKEKKYNGISADPNTEICVSSGATGALYCACYALFRPGDEILLFEPYYGYHEHTMLSLGIKPVYAKLTPPNWNFDLEEMRSLLSERTKAILICTPSNPCGKVYSQEELELLADFAIENDLIVLTDEIYEYITYDGRKHISPASIERIKDRTVTISGYSKTFSITGWRIGYTVASPQITEWIGAVNDLIYVCAPAPLQYGVAKAIETLDDTFYENMRESYQRKRNMICNTLQEVGLTPYVPQGAYYILTDVSKLPGKNSKERAMWLLKETGIAVVPGEAFYKDSQVGKGVARFCFAKDEKVIGQACDILKKNQYKWR